MIWEKKSSLNKERQIERGGRDGNGKQDEVIPVGAAFADLLNPSILFHLLITSFFHYFSLQGEAMRQEIEKGGASVKGIRSDINSDIRRTRGQRLNRQQFVLCKRKTVDAFGIH